MKFPDFSDYAGKNISQLLYVTGNFLSIRKTWIRTEGLGMIGRFTVWCPDQHKNR